MLAGCTGDSTPGPTKYVTVAASNSAAARSSSQTSTAASSAKPHGSPTPTTPAFTKLRGTCDNLLPLGSVVNAVGQKIAGKVAFVVGQADADTGRLTYLNCRYGLSKQKPVPAVEIGVNLYGSAAKAKARIRPTVDDYTAHGATATSTKVDGKLATLLDGGRGNGYGPTIVLAVDQRTVAVSLRPGAVASNRVVKVLVAVTRLAAQRTSLH